MEEEASLGRWVVVCLGPPHRYSAAVGWQHHHPSAATTPPPRREPSLITTAPAAAMPTPHHSTTTVLATTADKGPRLLRECCRATPRRSPTFNSNKGEEV